MQEKDGPGAKDEAGRVRLENVRTKVLQGQDSPGSYSGMGEAGHTVSSYSGIFNRMGLPLPRSARVQVDYEIL